MRLIVGLIALTPPSILCAQDERIQRYHSDIEVRQDGSLQVTEKITVSAAGKKINRGIYRDFPTAYQTKYLVRVELPFDVVSVKRDGQPEPYHSEPASNGIRVYVGSKDVRLQPGTFTYEITYTTDYQLGYFDTHDELYWNVTGNGWDFAIDEASATVRLPADIPRDKLTHEGYTGPQGSKARNRWGRAKA